MRRVEFHPEAQAEVRSARDWYLVRSPAACEAFVAELEFAVDPITLAPYRWPEYMEGTRRCLLRRFPYLLVYRVRPGTIQILAVAHASRRPGCWKRRAGQDG